MAGLPLGAAQTHIVPLELRDYAHVNGIEFIEVDPSLPYPRSAAYRKTPQGAQMLVRDAAPELMKVDLSIDQARELIDRLRIAGLFDWQRVFKAVQGSFVDVACEWRIEVDFDQNYARRSSTFRSEGEDEFPDAYDIVVEALLSQAQSPDARLDAPTASKSDAEPSR